nr:Uncharacterised protein [Citrobacter werkmanii]
MQSAAHQEKYFQQYIIIDRFVEQGWKLGDSKFYDTERAVYPEDLENWIKSSGQQEKMDKLERLNGAKTLEVLMDRLDKALEKQGTMQVLRRGFFYCRLRPDRDDRGRTGRQAQCSSH